MHYSYIVILKSKYNFLLPYKVKNLKRYGRNFDGGYLICDDISKSIDNLITLGVGDDISFELDFFKKRKLDKVYLYDYTVNHYLFIRIILKYLRRTLTFRSSINNFFYSIKNYLNFIVFVRNPKVFLKKKMVVKNIKKKNEINLNKIFLPLKGNKNLLKIDIEGGEYTLIDEIISKEKRINTLILEFHWINRNMKQFTKAVNTLKSKFDIIHIHANNYRLIKKNEDFFDVIEMTFVNKTLNKVKNKFRYDFPIKGLDYECFPNHEKIKFSFSKKNF